VTNETRVIGTVQALARYPVKSLRGENLDAVNLRWPGIDGDRQYAFLRQGNRSRFPWLTGRELADLIVSTARYVEPGNPRKSPVRVTTRDGEHDLHDPALLAQLSRAAGEAVGVFQLNRGTFDAMPVSVLSTATVDRVAARAGTAVDIRRFRANIVIAPADGSAREDAWLGGTLLFGDTPNPPKLRLTTPIERCSMITIDPDTASRQPGRHSTEVEG
jgi:hypothetical protein